MRGRWTHLVLPALVALAAWGNTSLAAQDGSARDVAQALALLESGDAAAAEVILREVVARAPHHGPANFQLGRLAFERGDAEAARAHLAIAVDAPLPRPYLAWQLLARAESAAGRAVEAARAWEEAARRAAETLATQPGNLPALRVAVAAAEALGDPWAILAAHRALLERAPAAPPVLAGAAQAAGAVGAIDAALALAERAVVAAPDDPALRHLLATLQLAADDAAAAASSCRRALELGGPSAAIEVTLGRALFAGLEVEPAVAAYGRALTADARVVGAIPRVALSALAAADPGALQARLAAVEAADPGHSAALYGLALAAQFGGDLSQARAHFERLAALEPEDPEVTYNLGRIYLRLGEEELGRATMERFDRLAAAEAVEWERRNEAFRDRLEAAELGATQPQAALAIYQRLAAAGLATVEDFVAAGRLLLDLGDGASAAAWFERVLEATPYHRAALEGLVEAGRLAGLEAEAAPYRRRLDLVSRLAAGPERAP